MFAVVHTSLTQSPLEVADNTPVEVVVVARPNLILCPEFCCNNHKPVPFPTISITVPKVAPVGNVMVVVVDAVVTYPLFVEAVNGETALFQVNPPIDEVDKVCTTPFPSAVNSNESDAGCRFINLTGSIVAETVSLLVGVAVPIPTLPPLNIKLFALVDELKLKVNDDKSTVLLLVTVSSAV